jgi:SOS-response transcriptional repressor LexA
MPGTLTDSVLQMASDTSMGRNTVLRVKGDTLLTEHICNGDYLVVSVRAAVEGETVVASVGDVTRVGVLRQGPGGERWIESAELLAPPLWLSPEAQVQGVVVAVIRKPAVPVRSPLGARVDALA